MWRQGRASSPGLTVFCESIREIYYSPLCSPNLTILGYAKEQECSMVVLSDVMYKTNVKKVGFTCYYMCPQNVAKSSIELNETVRRSDISLC